MDVRIDQRPERAGAFQPRIELQAKLPRQLEVGALPGGDDDAVRRADLLEACSGLAFEQDLPCRLLAPPSCGSR